MTGRPRYISLFMLAGLIGLIAASGCSKKPKPAVVPPVQAEDKTPEPPPPPKTEPEAKPASDLLGLKDVFFDYDKAIIRGDMQEILSGNGRYLVDNAGPRILLEGHCDERGTVEYNLALGERRAMAVKNYLIQYGVDVARLSTISYGEEKPFAVGHDESAWSQNRRVHFIKQ